MYRKAVGNLDIFSAKNDSEKLSETCSEGDQQACLPRERTLG
jgi:hypothetical protein